MIGRTLGHYRIVERLGEGGMGVVWKARDTHLDRLVAIKVLPAEKVADPQRKARFVQEAKAASGLNHPNIVTIHDIDQAEGVDFIAMECVAGRTLDQVIPRHGMRVNEALTCAVQMADALAKAHAAGIIHRDLKPGNVMVTDEGQVKVLDFGLAKLMDAVPQGDEEPTRTVKPATEEGTIVGTVAYMSPEQAQGKQVDARSDIFSFGAVLYEMLTGRQAFQEESKTSTLGAIIHKEPEALGAEVPQELSRLITRCLRKDPERRVQFMKDLKVELEELKEDSDSGKLARIVPAVRKRPWRWLWAAATAAAVLLAGTLVWQLRQVSLPSDLTPVAVTAFSGTETQPSFSPDGSKVAFVWNGDREDNYDIYVKQIGSAGPPMRLTANPAADLCPAWSPDDRWIAFMRWQQDGLAIMLIPPLGGPERTLTKIRGFQEQGWGLGLDTLSWTPDGKWLGFAERDAGEQMSIWAMSVDTGERRRLTTFQTTGRATEGRALGDVFPAFSPDGRTLAFARQERNVVFRLYALTLTRDLRPAGEPVSVTGHRYAGVRGLTWTADGHEIVYAAGGASTQSLWRVPVSGGQTPRRLAYALPAATYPAVARTPPRLVYTWTMMSESFWRLDTRTGERKLLMGSTYFSAFQQYSPDGRKIAFTSERSGNREVWTCDGDGTNCQQLTFFGGPTCGTPRWSRDGRWLALDSYAEGQSEIYVIAADGGTPRRVTNSPPFSNTRPSWSRDGQWIYFSSDRSGRNEIWKTPTGGGQVLQVTRSGGASALESPDGKYLYYTKEPPPSGVFRMPVDGGEEQQVLPRISAWSSFGIAAKGVYFKPDAKTIQFLDMATGKVRTLAALDKAGGSLCVSQDDAYVVWTQTDRNTRDLMLVEGFR